MTKASQTMLPATDLRQNVLTLAVSSERLPGVTRCLVQLLETESFDPEFQGQALETTYFDTPGFALRKARVKGKKYCTLRIRCYGPGEVYALSAKTVQGKVRVELPGDEAEAYLRRGLNESDLGRYLPGDVLARLLEISDGEPLGPVVTVCFRRYAVENATDRVTLDCGIRTNTGKVYPSHILENKTTARPAEPLPAVRALGLPPVKLSKFLWATA